MCVCSRLIFTHCSHIVTDSFPFRLCQAQKEYLAGFGAEPCKTKSQHGWVSRRWHSKCPKCVALDEALGQAKDIINKAKRALGENNATYRAVLIEVGIKLPDEGPLDGNGDNGDKGKECGGEGVKNIENEEKKRKEEEKKQRKEKEAAGIAEFLRKRKEDPNAALYM
ncbi:uncharacterized protein BCR38DRAFT_408242 [Pseudomassariella vexata]|uniref:Uncharacterized protein n=1 Tax=Pseudomassariella vexata TaxID=1141098 RepID=A0A1Y2E402_9PEZI|nr:uncharacterized protein BCR38DRAFT_408242 [Pseudomassariella vexata]ORY66288.1 hypothetical protein BCR38DRAFT_408242 [Pseudomassariella vexata]